MRLKSLLFLLFLLPCLVQGQGQILSYQRLATFTVPQIDSIANTLGIPSVLVTPEYPVDYYQVIYLTPYKHPDSLVQASMGLALPHSPGCDFPLFTWGHGTTSKRFPAASTMDGGQWDLGVIFASVGYGSVLPDYLGLGFADPKVKVHPYMHRFSQANTTINALRAARTIADSTQVLLNGQIFISGYSQGGFTAAATVREIQLNHAQEFQIAASAPMSGPYDLKEAQVDLISSDSAYAVPGYLPFLFLGYDGVYDNLFDSIPQIMKSPWDTVLPPLFL